MPGVTQSLSLHSVDAEDAPAANSDDAPDAAVPIRLRLLLLLLLSSEHGAREEEVMVTFAEVSAGFGLLWGEVRAVFLEHCLGREAETEELLLEFSLAGFESRSGEKSVVHP